MFSTRTILINTTLFCIFPVSFAFAQCNQADFYSGFESGNYTPEFSFLGGSTTFTVTTSSPALGNYCLQGTGGNLTHNNGLRATISPVTPSEVSWYIKPMQNLSGNYVVLGNSSISATNCIVFSYFQGSTGNLRFYTNSIFVDVPVPLNVWTKAELKNINYTTHTFDIYVNGVLEATSFPFRSNTQNDLSRIDLYNYENLTAYWDEIVIGIIDTLALSAFVTDVPCHGQSGGSIDLSVSGGTGVYNYLWSNGDMTEDISGLTAGNYTVIVTDTNNCDDSLTIQVNEPSVITMTAVTTDPATCGGTDGDIDISVNGGTPGYLFLWDNGSITEDISGLAADTFTVWITDQNNCVDSATFILNDPTLIPGSVNLSQDFACVSDGAFMLAGGSPSGGTWQGPGISGNMLDPTTAGIGIHTIEYLYTDTNNCNGSVFATVTIDACLGVDNEASALWKFYPNPATEQIILEIPQDWAGYHYEILTVDGRVLQTETLQGTTSTIRVSHLDTGIYLLRIRETGAVRRMIIRS